MFAKSDLIAVKRQKTAISIVRISDGVNLYIREKWLETFMQL